MNDTASRARTTAWGSLRKRGGGEASSFDDSYLKAYIKELGREVQEVKSTLEEHAEALVGLVSDASFQQHLVTYHTGLLDSETYASHYGSDDGEEDRPPIREIDHVFIQLTEHLCWSEKGKAFVKKLLSDAGRQDLAAWDNVLTHTAQQETLPDAMGQLLTHCVPYLTAASKRAYETGSAGSADVQSIVQTSEVGTALGFLDKALRLGGALQGHVAAVADVLKQRMANLPAQMYRRPILERRLRRMHQLADQITMPDKIDTPRFKRAAVTLAGAVASYQLFFTLKEASEKEQIAFTGQMMGLAAEYAEAVDRGSQGSGAPVGAAARTAGMVLNIIGHALGVVVSVMDVVDRLDEEDYDAVTIGAIGLMVGQVAFYSGLIASTGASMGLAASTIAVASTVAAVCTIVLIFLAVLLILLQDDPMEDYLSKTYWGTDSSRLPVDETVRHFYQRDDFELNVEYDDRHGDPNEAHVEIEGRALNESLPVHLELLRRNKSLGRVMVLPQDQSKDGRKMIEWFEGNIGPNGYEYEPRLTLYRPWELWEGMHDDEKSPRVAEGPFFLKILIDPDLDGRPDIKEGLHLESFNVPIRREIERLRPVGAGVVKTHRGTLTQIRYGGTANGTIAVEVEMRDAVGCLATLKWKPATRGYEAMQTRPAQDDRMIFHIEIPDPASLDSWTDSYHLKLACSLTDDGDTIDRHPTEDDEYVSFMVT